MCRKDSSYFIICTYSCYILDKPNNFRMCDDFFVYKIKYEYVINIVIHIYIYIYIHQGTL